jgi:phosphate transport system substrate-binding protein
MVNGMAAGATGAALGGTLNAGGSTFQQIFQEEATSGFKAVQPGITVNYSGVGSGAGRTLLYKNSVLMAASDSSIPAKELPQIPKGKQVLYFPVVVGPITLAYNLPSVPKTKSLKLSPTVIADIFNGKVTTWNDAEIAAENPGVTLPNLAITLAVRSDSSGTTSNFTQFLVKSAGAAWPASRGTGSTIPWPAGNVASKGNNGVAGVVQSKPGAIGYVDYATSKAFNLSFAEVANKDGNFVTASPATSAAAAAETTLKPDETFSAVWAGGAQSYPITYQSWDIVYAKQPNENDVKMLQAYLGFLLGAGQELLPQLGYAPLPVSIDQQAIAQLSKITS